MFILTVFVHKLLSVTVTVLFPAIRFVGFELVDPLFHNNV